MIQTAPTTGSRTLRPDLYGQDLYFIVNDVTLTGNVVYALSNPPSYDGQKVDVVFTNTHTLNGFTLNLFGLVTITNVSSVSPFIITLYGYNSTWIPRLSGCRAAYTLQVVGTQAAIPNTSGATLGDLELEVNKLKAALRNTAIIAP
jgi:hypothetical protein